MLFPVRCVFWLGVVYTSIAWPAGSAVVEPSSLIPGTVAATASSLVGPVGDALIEGCRQAPASCLAVGRSAAVLAAGSTAQPVRPHAPAAPKGSDTLLATDRAIKPPIGPARRRAAA